MENSINYKPGITQHALYLSIFVSFLFNIQTWGQGTEPNITDILTVNKPKTAVEVMPSFIGGDEALLKFISKNLRNPISAQLAGIEGRCSVRFVIERDGSTSSVEITKSVNPAIDNEVIRLIKSMPKWTPGRERGVIVPVYYNIPILFKQNVENPPKLPKQPKEPTPLTLIQINNGQSISTPNAATNKDLPLILVDNNPYQIEGLDWTKASDSEIFSVLNLTQADVESTSIINGEAAKKWQGERMEKGILVITTKK